ncbi:MAG: starch-binding protein [Clostridia bacterium]|nr:starch-binding protein [Clostridia bacterium]
MRKLNNKRLVMSVIALTLVLVLAAGFTYSWMEGGNKGSVTGNEIVISSGSNLTMRQDGKTTNAIIIPACNLEEVSSADGRNFFLPLSDNTSSVTSQMAFREGIAADENTKYVSVDFELESGDSAAEVYLGAGTIVQCSNQKLMNALRMSFSKNDGTAPTVFKPNQMPGVDMKYNPITTITTAGAATTTETSTEAYGDYYFKGEDVDNALFRLEKGETLYITLSVWLEGTEFTGDDIANSDLSIYIDFTTTVDDLVKYNFVDNCHNRAGDDIAKPNHWVGNNIEDGSAEYATMMYIYDNATHRYYAMEKSPSGTEWSAYVPNTINNFYFRRYSIDIDEWWNEWEPDMTDIKTDPKGAHTFVAICGQTESEGTNLDGCYGYWKDEYGTFRIYFEMQAPFSNLMCYAWDTNGDPCPATGEWPGKGMEFAHNTDNGVLYYIDLKETENVDGIQFNNGGETRVYLEGFGYGTGTAAYVYFDDKETGEEKYPLGVWSGSLATYEADNTVGNYFVKFTNSAHNHNQDFNIIANNKNTGDQYPASGGAQGKIGRVYRFNNGSTTLEKLAGPYEIKDDNFDQYIFNGAVFWYKSDDEHGHYIYTDSDDSLIYPVNDPTP